MERKTGSDSDRNLRHLLMSCEQISVWK